MATVIFYLLMASNALYSLANPAVGVMVGYLFAMLTPQNIWWWVFQDVRGLLWVMVPMLAGFAVAVLRKKVDYRGLNTKLNWCVGLWWLSAVVSYYFGPYVNVVNEWRFYDSPAMFSDFQKTYIMYFAAVLLIDNTKKLKLASIAILVTAMYMTYWANSQYLFYGKFGRLHGPTPLSGYSIYFDENIFSVLFVIGFPFIFFLGRYLYPKRKILALLVWAFIPLSWHAVFLTASRGALLAIAAVVLVFTLRMDKKIVGIGVLIAFLGAFAWQAGDVMKSRSNTITSYQDEDSANARLEAWEAATRMMFAHPLTGVGFTSFGQAFPTFSENRPRVAHNTFFQVGGEWGVLAAVIYLVLMFSTMNRLRKNGNRLLNVIRSGPPDDDRTVQYYINESCLYALIGFFICALFLSMQSYDFFYYLLLMANAVMMCSGFFEAKAAVKSRTRLVHRAAPAGRASR